MRLEQLKNLERVAYIAGDGVITDDPAYGDLEPNDTGDYFFLPCASGSDYSGDTVTKANALAFLSAYRDTGFVWEAHGGWNTYAVVIGLTGLLACSDDLFNEILDILTGLENYPVIDEEALCELEMHLADEAWDSWAEDEFKRYIKQRFDCDFNWPKNLRWFFEQCAEDANECWRSDGPDMHIDIDQIVSGIDAGMLDPYIVKYTVTWNDCGERTERYTTECEASDRVTELRESGFVGANYLTSLKTEV